MSLRALLAVVIRPHLWATALEEGWRLAPPGWWRRWPPRPLPDPAYLRFRMQTAYGNPSATPSAEDLLGYLHWCRRMRSLARKGHF